MQLLKLTGRDICSSETHQVTAEVLKTDRILQQGEVSLLRVPFFFLKTMIFDFFLSSGAFLNHNPVNKNNKIILITAVFHFVDQVQKDR